MGHHESISVSAHGMPWPISWDFGNSEPMVHHEETWGYKTENEINFENISVSDLMVYHGRPWHTTVKKIQKDK